MQLRIALLFARIQQPVKMGDEVARMGIVDGCLGLRLPGDIGRGVIGRKTDKVDFAEAAKLGCTNVYELAAEHEVGQLI